jgi:glyoxylase-like metal-dependent hydrolase (beta-lactamase superfamily II)
MKIIRIPIGELQANCYLLFGNNNEVIVVDPGDGEVEKVIFAIGKYQVSKIINTHYHFDHTNNVEELKKITGAKVCLHQDDQKYADFKVDESLQDGEKIYLDNETLQIIHTPGHTGGSICLLGKDFIITGDTFFENGYGRTDLAGGSEVEMMQTLKRRDELLGHNRTIYPGHGEEFGF